MVIRSYRYHIPVDLGTSLRHYTVDPINGTVLSSGNPFKYHEAVVFLQPMIPPKRFDIFPPDWGMLRQSRLRSEFSLTTCSIYILVQCNNTETCSL